MKFFKSIIHLVMGISLSISTAWAQWYNYPLPYRTPFGDAVNKKFSKSIIL